MIASDQTACALLKGLSSAAGRRKRRTSAAAARTAGARGWRSDQIEKPRRKGWKALNHRLAPVESIASTGGRTL